MRAIVVAAVVAVFVGAGSGSGAAATGIVASCNGGPCDSGWYTSNVDVVFTLPAGSTNPQGCGNQTLQSDTSGVTFSCSVVVPGSQCCRLDVTIKRDATPPTVSSVALARSPDSNGWYNHAVGVTATGSDAMSGIASCTSPTYSGPDGSSASVAATCTDNAGNVSAATSVTFQYDATPPSASGAATRAPDANGWYNHPVGVAFGGTDSVSGIASCTTVTYSGPDTGSAPVAGSCTDNAGNSANASTAIQYDATPPTVTGATPNRQPDANGWYNHPLSVAFAGSDATSGIASCDSPSYDQPNGAHAAVTGTCRDAAGNTSAPATFGFQYDDTPPTVAGLLVTAADRSVGLTWKPSADVVATKVIRSRAGSTTTVFAGKRAASFIDRSVHNGMQYGYTVEVFDQAGNVAVVKAAATPAAPLVSPRAAAHVAGGVTLRWRPVARATYYNVQLWHAGKKVLTAWPSGTSYRPGRLQPGRYTWIVWPGFGSRARAKYGAKVGTSSFVVTR